MKRYISVLLALAMLFSLAPTAAFADSDMTGSGNIKLLIKNWEGCVLTAYKAHPSEQYWTIGYGHYGSDVYEGMKITAEQADAYFEQDIKAFEKAVNGWNDKYSLNLTQNQFDAMLSLTYNFGTGWVEYYGAWRLSRYVQAGFKDSSGNRLPDLEIADSFGVLCSAGGEILPGLINRRINEAEIFLYNNYSTDKTNFVYTLLDANGGSLTSGNRVQIFTKNAPYGTLPGVSRSGYTLSSWVDSDTGSPILASTVADKDRNLKATWTTGPAPARYTLTVNGGSGSGSYTAGEKIRLVPYTQQGKTFAGWDVSGASAVLGSDGYYYITMPAKNVTATALWGEQSYTLTVNGGSGSGNYTVGTRIKLVPTPQEGKNFAGWDVTGATAFKDTDGYYYINMPAGNVTATAVWTVGCPLGDQCPTKNFTDIPISHWAHADVDTAVGAKIFKGTSDTTFEPETPMTRAMLVTVLYRLEGGSDSAELDESQYKNPYTDIEKGNYYYNAVLWAYKEHIANGFEDGTFLPDKELQREELVTMLHRYARYKGWANDDSPWADFGSYADAAMVSDFARESMSWAVGSGIINGIEGNRLDPLGDATRAQVATVLVRFAGSTF